MELIITGIIQQIRLALSLIHVIIVIQIEIINLNSIKMTKRNNFTFCFICSLCLSLFVSCSSQDDILDDISKEENANQKHTCELVLNVTKEGFNDEAQSRSASGWENGDKIFLTFTVGTDTSYGDAVFNNGSWTVSYYGSLTEGATAKCTAVYFDNPEFESSSVVKISENTGIYEDSNGSYVYSGGTLSVTANLKPKTGRIRFAGTEGDKIIVYGITHHTSYDCSNGKFTNSIGALNTTVSSGYTPYIYGEFSDAESPRLNIITSTSGYTRLLSSTIFKTGESGYMTIPSETAHKGWQNSVIFKVNGVEFTMILVDYGSNSFLLAETETTKELYHAIILDSSTNSVPNPKTPIIGYSSWNDFLSSLNAITELTFGIPTFEEWYHAAIGGSRSQGYIYSGSNNISNIAWYSGNSNNLLQNVKQLQPNELGFYDMTGNAWETVIYNGSYYGAGGGYTSSVSNCVLAAGAKIVSTGTLGLRLILRISNL